MLFFRNPSFKFKRFGILSNGEITVKIRELCSAKQSGWGVSTYKFDVTLAGSRKEIGTLDLRIGDSNFIVRYAGHIGYGIHKKYRGRRYAAQACRLVETVARHHDLTTLWITCNPDNDASRRTCEILGCQFIEIVDVPPQTDLYQREEKQKCRYRWELI